MTRYFLKRVQIEGFRGINNEAEPLDLRLKPERVNSIFAPNGLGKSSIFDALCYAIRCRIPKLDGLPATEKANDYYCNRFHSTQTATISLTLAPDDATPDVEITIQRSPQGVRSVTSATGHANPESLLRSIDNAFILLDHRAFLRFVEDSPLDRGRTFSSLLGLSELSEFRQVLDVLSHARTVKSDFQLDSLETQRKIHDNDAQAQLRIIRARYNDLLDREMPEPLDHASVVREVTDALAHVPLLSPFLEQADITSVDYPAIHDALAQAECSAQRQRLSVMIRSIAALEKSTPAPAERDEQAELRRCIEERDAALAHTKGPLFAEMYQAVLDVATSEDWSDPKRCPACDSPLETPIAESVRSHLQQYTAAADCRSKIINLWHSAAWVARFQAVENDPSLAIPQEERQFQGFNSIFRNGTPTLDCLNQAIACLHRLDEMRQTQLNDLQSAKAEIEKDLAPSLVALTRKITFAEQLNTALDAYQRATEASLQILNTLANRKRWQRFIDRACQAFSEAELKLSTVLTTAIETQYRAMYRQITNNPEVVPALVRAKGSEELHLRLERFYGLKNVSATTLLPESYRNALAMSIFLSAALQSPSTGRFILLDDVTSSFDAGHQFALMEVIRLAVANPGNPDGPQVIILSHDGLLEKYFDKISNTAPWHHQKLQGMPPCGCILGQAQNATRLRTLAVQLLNAGDIQRAEPLVRQHLEFKLLEIIRSVNIPVPLDFCIRDDRKMVENAIKVCTAAVTLHQQAGTLILTPQQVTDLQSVHVPAILGNWVNHYATGIASSVSPHVLLGVLDSIDRFAACFQRSCTCSGTPVQRYYKSLDIKGCSC